MKGTHFRSTVQHIGASFQRAKGCRNFRPFLNNRFQSLVKKNRPNNNSDIDHYHQPIRQTHSGNFHLPLFQSFAQHAPRPAISDLHANRTLNYHHLLSRSHHLSDHINTLLGSSSQTNFPKTNHGPLIKTGTQYPQELHIPRRGKVIYGRKVGILTQQSSTFFSSLFAVWRAGHTAVPLAISHPPEEWAYFLEDSECAAVITDTNFSGKISPVCEKQNRLVICAETFFQNQKNTQLASPQILDSFKSQSFTPDWEQTVAQIIYTSGTTGRPKGTMHTHGNIAAMIECLKEPWKRTHFDQLLGFLPLHHVHGLVVASLGTLASGGHLSMLPKPDSREILEILLSPKVARKYLSQKEEESRDTGDGVLMAVPTVYAHLVNEIKSRGGLTQSEKESLQKEWRLMVSGSMSLPDTLFNKWYDLTGHKLLERYGMTEIGMALSNEYANRIPGTVGKPLPGVQVKIAQDAELLIKGPSVFAGYWNRDEATQQSFDTEGWFLTGDNAQVDQNGIFKILGRRSVDIIKHKGYKISALEIERALLENAQVKEVAVVGIQDETVGQKLCAVVVAHPEVSESSLKLFLQDKIAPYKIPSFFLFTPNINKNAMGKVNKKELVKLFSQMT